MEWKQVQMIMIPKEGKYMNQLVSYTIISLLRHTSTVMDRMKEKEYELEIISDE